MFAGRISTMGRKLGYKYWVVQSTSSLREKVSISGIVHIEIGYESFHLLNLQRLHL